MRPVHSTDAQYLRVHVVNLTSPEPGVELQHHLRDDSGTVTDYWIQLTPSDARRLAKHLIKAADKASPPPNSQEA